MRVALNGLAITNRSGTGRYVYGLIEGFVRGGFSNDELRVFLPSSYQTPSHWRDARNLTIHPVPAMDQARRIIWEQWRLPRLLRELQADVLHAPAFVAPVYRSRSAPYVVTIHDRVFQTQPQTIPWVRRLYYQTAIPASIRHAAAVLTDAQCTATGLQSGYPASSIRAIYLGVDRERYHPHAAVHDEEVLSRHRIKKPYYLAVGTLEPRKNLPLLIEAFTEARQRGLQAEMILVGRYGWSVDAAELQRPGVRALGYLAEDDLPPLFRHAQAFCAPSFEEGFNLPVAEALACGAPVMASDIAVHREVYGQAALLLPCRQTGAWTQALLGQKARPGEWRRDWQDVMQETFEVYRQAVASHPKKAG